MHSLTPPHSQVLHLRAPNFLGMAKPLEGPDTGLGAPCRTKSPLAPTAKDRVQVGKRRLSPELRLSRTPSDLL